MVIVIGMAFVTMVPRLIPVFIVDKIQFPNWLNGWLDVIPYAALGALIFPGVLTVIPEKPWIGFIGSLFAVLFAVFRANIIFIVLGASIAVFLLTLY
ncbi:Branched-chain amino acid transport protein (AzlD) [Paraliobacillus sp. PM-2]|uniref:AzlD domain-containing protein n=1 Tax=Paraliobacillus sp. PM-2 TaxID=1462524 RepID=UPI00061BEC8E|nr:Branched-chain amino acid transport protein (AzlD) [Paraliobacillus sp. PM-2]